MLAKSISPCKLKKLPSFYTRPPIAYSRGDTLYRKYLLTQNVNYTILVDYLQYIIAYLNLIASNLTVPQPTFDSSQLFLSDLWITLSCKLVRTKVKQKNIE